jgi:hypothetical protein
MNALQQITRIVLEHGTRHMEHPLLDLNLYFNALHLDAIREVGREDPEMLRLYEQQLKDEIIRRDIENAGQLLVRVFGQHDFVDGGWTWVDKRVGPALHTRPGHYAHACLCVRMNFQGELIGDDAEIFTGEGKQQLPIYQVFRDGMVFCTFRERIRHDNPRWNRLRLGGEWFLTPTEYYDWMEERTDRHFPPSNTNPPPWGQQTLPLKILASIPAQYRSWIRRH